MKSIKRSGLLLAAMLLAVLAMSSMVMAREGENAAESQTPASDALAIALAHLEQNKTAWGLTTADLAVAKVTDTTVSRLSGVTTIYLGQQLGGIEVFNGVINISVMPNGEILMVGNRFVPDLSGTVSERTASMSAEQAVNAAATHLGLTLQAPLQIVKQATGSAQETLFSDGGISQNPIPAKLVYDASGKVPRLAWNVIIYQLDSLHWWNVRVDAITGDILSQNDWVNHDDFGAPTDDAQNSAQGGVAPAVTNAGQEVPFGPTPVADGSSYRVYHLPIESPSHSSPPAPADGRTLENQPADAGGGSPFGWHDTNGAVGAEFTTTQGNNVHGYTDVDANNVPDAGSSPNGGVGLDFNFPLDLTQAPSAYQPAAVTNLFHWNNLVHDVNYRYGFDEAHGNFQENNYGNGGAGSDYVQAEAQDGSGFNNANFATPTDGQNPRMQMYIWTAPTPDRDGDLDNGIVAHEYGHGISNRMVGGPTNVNCLNNNEQMGEGWSDWQSVILTMRTGDTATTNRGVGTYALNQPTNGVGIRPAPYTTDMGVNGYTYGDLPTLAVPHGVGFLWNTMLWEMNWGLIAEHGFNQDIYLPNTAPNTWSGNQLAHALVMEGFNNTVCSPGFVDGRNAILAADEALTGGANQCIIWEAFATRGLGFSASQGSNNSTGDGIEAFDMPPACLTLNVITSSNDICQGDTAVYTVGVGTAFTPPVAMSATGNPAPSTATFNPNPVITVPSTTDLTIGNTGAVAAGGYTINIAATDGTVSDNADVTLNVFAGAPGAPTLVSPPDGATGIGPSPTLSWNAVANTSSYLVEVADDAAFTNIVYSASETTTTHDVTIGLNSTTTYYWRVTGENACGSGTASAAFDFTTGALECAIYTSTDVPVAIPDNTTVTSLLNIPDAGEITDVNVVNIAGTHTYVGDLEFRITSPAATQVQLQDNICGTNENFDIDYDDEAAPGAPPCPPTNGLAYQPFQSLSALDGEASDGDWIFSVTDTATVDTGSLNSWGLEVCYVPGGTPTIDVSPASLSATQAPNNTSDQTLSIGNIGTGNLDWSIAEDPTLAAAVAAPANPSHTDRAGDGDTLDESHSAPSTLLPTSQPGIVQGTFSEGFDDITTLPGAGWAQINNSSPLGTSGWFQGNDTAFPSQSGAPTSYIGANYNNTSGTGTISNWLLTPEINLADDSTMTFYTRVPTGSSWPDRLEVRMSTAGSSTDVGATATSVGDFTNLLLEINPTLVVGGYPEVWTQFTVTLSGVGTPTTGRLAFRYFVTDGGPSGSNSNYIGIDTVEYTYFTPQGPCTAPSDVPWLSVSPSSGTTGAGGTSDVTVTFDSTGLAVGNTYTATLCVESNDTATPLVTVPVSLSVVAGGTAVWDGGGVTNNWSEATNWVGDVVPQAADTVLFDTTSTKDSLLDVAFPGTVANIIINSGYTGTITMDRSFAVTGDYTQVDGVFVVSDPATAVMSVGGNMTHTSGSLRQTRPVNGTAVTFLQIENGVAVVKYRGVNLDATTSNLGAVTVNVRAVDRVTQFCTETGAMSGPYAGRCFNVTPTTAGTAILRLYALTSELPGGPFSPAVYHDTTGTGNWELLTANAATGTIGTYTYAEAQATGFSPFLIGDTSLTPTAVTLTNISTANQNALPMVATLLIMLLLFAGMLYRTKRKAI